MARRPAVTIVQRRLTDYRVPLFELMRQRLDTDGIALRLLHGDPTPYEARKHDGGVLPWAERLPTQYWWNDRVCWQPFARQAAGSDLVILTQENKLVHNLLALATHPWPRLAFWGHGRNLQSSSPNGLRERFKRLTTRQVDWWFAYTCLTEQFLHEDGYPADRISVVNNSVDTTLLQTQVRGAMARNRAELRAEFGLEADALVGVFIGSLYPVKCIPELLSAAAVLQAKHPKFRLLVAGDGAQRHLVEAAAARPDPAVRFVGRATGDRKAAVLAASDVFLHPGGVGLNVLDAFVAGLPMITSASAAHGPEVAYLRDGHNALICTDRADAFVAATSRVLVDLDQREHLARGARQSAGSYTLERMADRFCGGIRNALERPPQRCH